MSIVEKYDMLLKCYHHLHVMANCEIGFVDQKVDEDWFGYF
jgi:hypothetical protein